MAVTTPQPGRLDLVVIQGTDQIVVIAVTEEDGTVLDLTGWAAKAQVRPDIDEAAVIECSTANGRIAVGLFGTAPDQYNIELMIPKTLTTPLDEWGQGVWDCEVTDTFGKVLRILSGCCVLDREVTR